MGHGGLQCGKIDGPKPDILKVRDQDIKHIAICVSCIVLPKQYTNFNIVRTRGMQQLDRAVQTKVHNVGEPNKDNPIKNIPIQQSDINAVPER